MVVPKWGSCATGNRGRLQFVKLGRLYCLWGRFAAGSDCRWDRSAGPGHCDCRSDRVPLGNSVSCCELGFCCVIDGVAGIIAGCPLFSCFCGRLWWTSMHPQSVHDGVPGPARRHLTPQKLASARRAPWLAPLRRPLLLPQRKEIFLL